MEDMKRIYAKEAWRLAGLALREKLPWLSQAAGIWEFVWTEGRTGMDGVRVSGNAEEILSWFRESPAVLERRFLHLLLHGLYLHSFREPRGRERVWWVACDLMTEYRIDRLHVDGFAWPVPDERGRYYRKLREEQIPMGERKIAEWIGKQAEEELLRMERAFRVDGHALWHTAMRKNTGKGMEISAPELSECIRAVHHWREAFEKLELQRAEHRRQAGGSIGTRRQMIQLEKEQGHDYRQFLKRFAVEREELVPDMDSFDYIPYHYSRDMYERLVLLEPLEYRDVRKLEEFVIAIDTSGSCSGEVVRRFLEETWEILNEKENFFRDMRLHLIQCDCVVQEHRVVTCEEEWRDYLEHVVVQGHGDTDFTPVFRLVERMLEEKELKHLLGLLYFTDGDGVYPSKPPEYETAFVFLSKALQKGQAPDWAVTLTLD